jgi:hypothetical protein
MVSKAGDLEMILGSISVILPGDRIKDLELLKGCFVEHPYVSRWGLHECLALSQSACAAALSHRTAL